MSNKPTQEEIDRAKNIAAYYMDEGTKFPGMSYEQGIVDTIAWLDGRGANPTAEHPEPEEE